MASESSFEDSPAATPQPLAADLTSSMVGAASSSNTTAAELTRLSKDEAAHSSTMSSSMTPPPSTQAAAMRDHSRGGTPLMLSSPPPTITKGITRNAVTTSNSSRYPSSQINAASPEQLREIIHTLVANEAKHEALHVESRMTIAHLNLQLNMLSAEKESEIQRMEVEHNMTKREVSMLSMARSDINTPGSSLLTNYIKLDEKHHALIESCDALYRRLERAKRVIESKEDKIADLEEDIKMYQKRIQEKHDLYQSLRSPGGPFHSSNLKIPTGSVPNTPQQHRGTPKRTPGTARPLGREEPFAALLLADRIINQENNSAPSTPIISRRPEPRTPIRHQRAAQSLSSLQTTPGSARQVTGNASLLPSAQFNPESHRVRRRKSRDSTISAPDAEEIARAAMASFHDDSEEDEDINESQASQAATQLLRADPKESFEVVASRNGTPVPAEKGIQAKLHTTITKNSMEKRKYVDDGGDSMAKKARTDVGLGIFSPRA